MSPRRRGRGRTVPLLIGCLYAGGAAGWWLHATFAPAPAATAGRPAADLRPDAHEEPSAVATAGREGTPPPTPVVGADPIAELRRHNLQLPVDGADIEAMKGSFGERRGAGARGHEAVDIIAPRNTAVRAVESGTIAKLFYSAAGGKTIYQFDAEERFCHYYAHLEDYARGLHEGQQVSRGEVIGYVGTSGNAPPNTPHLHFAVFELTADRRWWEGRPLDPDLVFQPAR